MKKTIMTSLVAIASLQLWGAGYQVLEQGASNMGTALAGATTNANNDASAAFWNPSAAFFIEGDIKIDATMNFLVPYISLDDGNPATHDGGNAGSFTYIPNMYTAARLAEDWILTFSVTSPYGLVSEYDSNAFFADDAIKSELFIIDINPSIAYKILDCLTVSAGFSAQYLYANMTSTGAEVKGNAWGFGYNLGATYEYMEGGRIGVSYRSEVDHSISGNTMMSDYGTFAATSDVTMPATINIGIYQRFWGAFEDFALMLDYCWTGWSAFENFDIYNENFSNSLTYENWKDTSRISFGMHYYATEDLTLRLGTAWDESPIKSAEYTTFRIPDGDRIWFSAGLGYKYHDMNFDFAYTYIIFNDAYINNGDVVGAYDSSAHVLSFQVGFTF